MTGLFQLATAGEASSSVCSVMAKKKAGSSPEANSGAAAEIVGGKSVRPLFACVAELPFVGLLAVAQDDDARRRRERDGHRCGYKNRCNNETGEHGYAPHQGLSRVRMASRSFVALASQDATREAKRCACDFRISPSSSTFRLLARSVVPVVVMSTISSAVPAARAASVAPTPA